MPENGPAPEGEEEVEIPVLVTFRTGADLLGKLKIVPSITREGVRLIAKEDPNWPFGPGRPHQYVMIGQAWAMETGPFLEFFRIRGKKGRGPARKPDSGTD